MTNTLKSPAEYLPLLESLREINCYAKHWSVKLERHTNRHPDCYGRPRGWYEVHPNNVVVGYWNAYKDDLKNVDIAAWNEEAKRISNPKSVDLSILRNQ
jgi:hypothetical protein